MISGNFLENLFKVKTSLFVFFAILVILITYLNPANDSYWFWLDPLNLIGTFNKDNKALSILFLFSILKIVVRVWEFFVSLSSYGKIYSKITTRNINFELIDIAIQKALIDFVESNYYGTLVCKKRSIIIDIDYVNDGAGPLTYPIRDERIYNIFAKFGKKIGEGSYEVKSHGPKAQEAANISPEFKNAVMELKNILKDDSETYALLETDYLFRILFKKSCLIFNKIELITKKS